MTAATLRPTPRPIPPTTWPVGLTVGSLAAAALVVAGVWNVLVQDHVTVDSPPAGDGSDASPLQSMHTYYSWYAGTVAQERGAAIAGMVGMAGLVILAGELRRRLSSGVLGRGACTAVQAGGIIWGVGTIIGIGGRRAVGLMATHGNPIETVNAIAFTTDVTSDAFSAAGLLLVGLALLGLAATATRGRCWSLLTGLTGLFAVVVAYGYITGIDSITTYVLGILAAALTPVWLVWTGRLLDRPEPPA